MNMWAGRTKMVPEESRGRVADFEEPTSKTTCMVTDGHTIPYHIVSGDHSCLSRFVTCSPPIGVFGGVLNHQNVAFLERQVLWTSAKHQLIQTSFEAPTKSNVPSHLEPLDGPRACAGSLVSFLCRTDIVAAPKTSQFKIEKALRNKESFSTEQKDLNRIFRPQTPRSQKSHKNGDCYRSVSHLINGLKLMWVFFNLTSMNEGRCMFIRKLKHVLMIAHAKDDDIRKITSKLHTDAQCNQTSLGFNKKWEVKY